MIGRNHTLCLILLCIYQLALCMDNNTDIIVQIVEAPKAPTGPAEIAKKAVRVTLGRSNEYVERMLTRRLNRETSKPNIIPIRLISESTHRGQIRNYLATETEKAQEDSVEVLKKQEDIQSPSEHAQTLTRWVLNAVLDEKLKDREIRENSDYWKYINGILAAALPVITGLIQYFITHRTCQNSGSN